MSLSRQPVTMVMVFRSRQQGRYGWHSSWTYARTGLNTYEQTLEPLFPRFGLEDQLLYDFDSGGSKHNAMAWWFSTAFKCGPDNDTPPWAQDGQCTTFKDGNYPDFKGYRKLEVGIASGDSGGPGFIGDKIAGVHSFGFTHNCTGVTNGTDFTCGLDSSFGEMSGDTRVSYYAPWIDAVVDGLEPTVPVGATPCPDAISQPEAAEFLTLRGKSFIENVYSATMRATLKSVSQKNFGVKKRGLAAPFFFRAAKLQYGDPYRRQKSGYPKPALVKLVVQSENPRLGSSIVCSISF